MNNPEPGNLFASTLNAVGYGDLAGQASSSLEELVKSVRETSKTGEMTVTLKIKPRGRDSGQVEVTGSVSVKTPIADVAPSMFFATENGELLRDNPAQRQLPFGQEMPKPVSVAANQ